MILVAPQLDTPVRISHSGMYGNDPSLSLARLGQTIQQAEIERLGLERVDFVRRINRVRENQRGVTDIGSDIEYVSPLEKLRMLRRQCAVGIFEVALLQVVASREKPLDRKST